MHGAAAAVAAALDRADQQDEEKAASAAASKHGDNTAGRAAAVRFRARRRAARSEALRKVGLPPSVLMSRASAGGLLARLPAAAATKAAACQGIADSAASNGTEAATLPEQPAPASGAESASAPSSGAGADSAPLAGSGSALDATSQFSALLELAHGGDFPDLAEEQGPAALPLHLSPFSGGRSSVPVASLRPVAAALRTSLHSIPVSFVGAREASEELDEAGGPQLGFKAGPALATAVLDRARALAAQHVSLASSSNLQSAEPGSERSEAKNSCAVVFVENLLLLDPAAAAGAAPLGELAGPSYESWNASDLVVGQGRELRWIRSGIPRVG